MVNKFEVTVVAPWLNTNDWTITFLKFIEGVLNDNNVCYNIILGQNKKRNREEELEWLYPKLQTPLKILKAKQAGSLANKLILLDSNFINLKAIRSIMGSNGQIITFINGGTFQDNDFDDQYLSSYKQSLLHFEFGNLNLVDKIIVPTAYAKKILVGKYPELEKKINILFYPLYETKYSNIPVNSKNGVIFPSRLSWEKGSDIIKEMIESKISINCMNQKIKKVYLKELTKHKVTLLPSRAELFGYCAIESVLQGTIPIVPAAFSYDETIMIPEKFKITNPVSITSISEIIRIINEINKLPDSEYQRIIDTARDHIIKNLSGQKEKFLEIIDC